MNGRRRLPTGTLTFVFTDVEGSTRLLQTLGERFHDVMAVHHELLRGAFARWHGVEVGTEGDAFFVVFPSAADAVEAAADVQRALNAHDWGEAIEVRVRIGLHTGDGKLAGEDYGGIDVHRAARIAAAAHGGQVVMSAETAALVQRSLRSGVTLKDLGDARLKDLDRPEHLYQLCVEGLRAEFPPPRGLEARPTNLPATLTAFVARDRELGEIEELVATNRLVTLTGPGGTGKTRLGLALGGKLLPAFRDGVFLVPLASLEEPTLVGSTIAQTLGLREHGALPVEDMLKDYLHDKELLLILDNFEQIVEAAPIVPELLEAGPQTKVLATSRIPLRVAGEQEYPVPPMALADPSRLPSVGMLSHYGAVDLFVRRARSVKPDFALTEANAAAVAEICWRLDGLPLAIELAAARIRLMSPQEMLAHLDASLSFLSGGARDLPERQRTLRGAIGWSYNLLDEPSKAFFRRLGVFSGGFDLEAAEHVTESADLGIYPLDAIEVVLDNSLVRRFESDAGATRYRLLQTIRAFALEQLEQAAEDADTRRRHAAWYLRHVEELEPRLTTGRDPLDAVDTEHDNVRSVLRWAIDSDNGDVALRLGSAMWRFWQMRGHLAEGRRWLAEIVSLPSAAARTTTRARAVMALGSIAYWQNDFVETRRYYREGLEIFRAVGDEKGLQEALYNVGFLSLLEKEPAAARDDFLQSRAIAQRRKDSKGLADTAWGVAMAAIQARDWDEARAWGAECGRLYDEIGDLLGRSLSQFVFYQVARYTGELDEARRIMAAYLGEVEADDAAVASSGLEQLAEIELLEGNVERALRLRGAADGLRDSYGGGSPTPLVDLSDVKEAARARLGEDRVEELWAEGRAMAPQEAVAYALKDEAAEGSSAPPRGSP